ncbi:MAG: hypothetical protein IKB25_08375 [Lentisphaeria bacterium]|nr:hypothetical protein [Lentisphaeria bacterium]
MKKLLCVVLLAFWGMMLLADEGRTFETLTKYKYKNVRIEGITWKGIRIRHDKGNRYITDKDLTAADKDLLKKELEIWRGKAEKHNRRNSVRSGARAEQEKELKALQTQLPKMNGKAVCNWFQPRIGATPYDKDFRSKYFSAFAYAKNGRAVMKAVEARMRAIDTEEFNKLKDACLGGSVAQANSVLRKRIGAAYEHPNFTENLRMRFIWVPVNVRTAFVNSLKEMADQEKICCFCKKEPSLKPGSYGKACSAKVCTKCQKNLVEKADANSKEKICESCKAEADGGGGDEVAPM